jgi:formate dehydrogenase subunit delta
MDTENLIRMANQIAANLACEKDAPAAIAEHIRLFWSPAMKQAICAYEGASLLPAAREAVARLAA